MKKYFKYSLIFLVIFFISFLAIQVFGFHNTYGDPINSYGFSKAISMGQIPYRDFNMIVTPLYAMYQSLFLHIYDDFIMINISQALIVTLDVILLYKLFGKKSLLLLIVVSLFQYANLIPTYNSLVLFFIILLTYIEKKYPNKDYLIGFLLGLAVMTKQTIGCFLVIPSIILYRKDLKKLLRRFVGFLIPCFIFLIYLICNKALYQFFDLGLFGMFDFASNNGTGGGHIKWYYIILWVVTIIFSLILLFKNKKDTNIYYLLCGALFLVPICDTVYMAFWLTCFMMMFLPYIKKYEKELVRVGSICSITFMVLCLLFWTFSIDLCVTKDINHFRYTLHRKGTYENLKKMNEFVNKYDDSIVIGYYSMYHTISNDKEFSYFNILYDGNYGYKGSQGMIEKIKKMDDQVFIVSMIDYNSKNEFSQFSKDIAKYVMDNYEKIDEGCGFSVYYKEGLDEKV